MNALYLNECNLQIHEGSHALFKQYPLSQTHQAVLGLLIPLTALDLLGKSLLNLEFKHALKNVRLLQHRHLPRTLLVKLMLSPPKLPSRRHYWEYTRTGSFFSASFVDPESIAVGAIWVIWRGVGKNSVR